MTATCFLRRPDGKPGRLYKTGDLGLRRADGLLEFVGRRDRQIKLRGFRIEPEEIESVLRTLPGVADAVVLNRESLAGEPALVAYLTPKPGVVLGIGEIRKATRSRLPSYMLPSSVVVLSVFPKMANGKIDRQALPMPDAAAFPQEPAPIAPRDHIEVGLTHMWTQLLGVPIASIHDQFFELGGHSLLATQVASRVREVFGVELPLRTFFEQPTIAALGETIREAQRQDRGQPKLSPIQPADRSQPLPLSSSQQRMWVLHQLAPQSTAYNMLFVSRQMGPLSRQALRQSADALVARHESFRTTFAMSEKGPIQRVSPELAVPWGEVDLRRLPSAQRIAEAKRLAEEEARRPFNLEAGPLVRFFLIQLEAEDHLLVLTMHHIISDQWSFGVLGREVASYYNAFVRGQELHMPPLAIQYGDFAAWQQRCLLDNHLNAQGEYWKEQLAGLLPLSLPTDFPRPAEQTFNGAYCPMDMSSSLITRIEEFSVERNATPFMTLLTCFFILLGRYSGSTDLAVGSPIANRTQAGLEGLIGTFVNTLVLRLDLSGDPTFAECVERVRAIALGAYANQDYSFEKLVESLHVTRDASYGPLVQVLFNMGNAPVGDVDLHGLTWVPFEADTGTAQFDLSLTVETVVSRKAHLTFNTDLFTRATAERMLMHYKVLLHQAVEAPETTCSALRWLTPAEEAQVIYGWNKTSEVYPDQDCLFELIESQVERSQQAVAVSMDGRTLTYQALNAKANQLARRLVALGVRPSNTVGLCLERSLDMVVAVLAVWKAGANYLPLDPEYPRDRLRFMLEDSGATLALTTTGLSGRIAVLGTRIVCLDQEQTALDQEPTHNLPRAATADDLAYVLYTSGSTGQPKGVEIGHRALVNFLCSMRQRPGCTADDVLLAVTTLSFDIAGLELYLPLMVGGRVEIASRAVAIDGAKLRDQLEASGATLMQATPATWRLLLGAGWAGRRTLTALCGGEAFPPDLAAELLKRTRAVWNMYGPTETTIWSAVSKLEPGDGEISIGRPIANTSLYILDERGAPVPVGVPGELYIGGHGVARGYRNRPDLTAARFLADPFACELDARMYRTGDRARYRADGSIVHLGRLDHQVKIRGFRIELGEIEAVLGRHQAVRQVVVTAREDEPGEKYLAAYLVRAEGQSVEVGELRSWTRAALPEYMLPTAYVFLDALPLTANNKIDVRALPPPRSGAASVGLEHDGPRDLIEVQLVALWQQVLNVQEIGIHENFFDLGGHSLTAAQLFYLLEQVYGKTLPLATLFHAPTIAELGDVLRREDWTPPWQSLVAIQPNGLASPCFMVPGVGGHILMFARLARLLGRELPVYGLQIRGVDGDESPFTVLPEMAAHYVSEVQRVQAKGPYLFVGSCTGGVIAYEMAQQLTAQGQAVTLVMLNTWHPKSYARHKSRLWGAVIGVAVILKKFTTALRLVRGLPLRERWVSLRRKCKAFLVYSLRSIVRHDDVVQLPAQRLKAATFGAIARYRVERFPGRIVNVVASPRLADEIALDTRYDWPTFGNGESRTIVIPAGNAGRLCEPPYVDELARCIQHVLSPDPGNILESNLKNKVSDAQ
ncbi:MAG: amino acid adenylation domain-containing protein [Nitrospira sp.]